jgi:tetratricopeptide (TPR) repeat protein
MTKPTVFISYSHNHEDELWKDRLCSHLGVLEKVGIITIWDDRQIDTGGKYFDKIKEVIYQSAVAVCLISSEYLNSDFRIKEEIPGLFDRREKEGMIIIPLLLRPCLWRAVHWLNKPLMLPRDGKSVSEDFKDKWDGVFTEVAESILKIIENPNYKLPKPTPLWSPPEKTPFNRLPMTGEELFGRQKELEMLDKAWASENTHIVSLVAWGGVGKSTLVNKWLERISADNYRGAQRVFAWAFHNQGSSEKITSSDLFFSEALSWFGDPDPLAGSPWDKGVRLAELIRKKKTLLVLDGLEPLQSAYEYERGTIKDPGMATLLAELARNNNGLCIITTREKMPDLSTFKETTCELNLEQISAEAGRALLRISGVQGTDAELEAATRDFGNHALALILLGVYLRDIKGHHISKASDISDLAISDEKGRHPRRMMAAFEKRFGEGPEVELLKILGHFDFSAEGGAIAAVRDAPPIANLTEHIAKLSEVDWLSLLERLRDKRLIAQKNKQEPDTLDCHPLIREHFRERLKIIIPDAWKEAHSRLYEYYKKSQQKEYPDTIEEMLPLYRAVSHGCQAGRHQEAFFDVYWKRILREGEFFAIYQLGAYGADLAALSGFFDEKWSKPVAGFRDNWKAWLLNAAGFALRALGRPAEAAQPMKASLEAYIVQEKRENAAVVANNLVLLYLIIGDITKALEYAKQSIKLEDRRGNGFQRNCQQDEGAAALHQAGSMTEAEHLFQEAERMQKNRQSEYPFLFSVRGFQYCDLLLDKRNYNEVLSRAKQTIKIVEKCNWLSDIALDNLSLGRAHLLQAIAEGTGDFSQAAEHLNQAVDGLRGAGTLHHLPRQIVSKPTSIPIRTPIPLKIIS